MTSEPAATLADFWVQAIVNLSPLDCILNVFLKLTRLYADFDKSKYVVKQYLLEYFGFKLSILKAIYLTNLDFISRRYFYLCFVVSCMVLSSN